MAARKAANVDHQILSFKCLSVRPSAGHSTAPAEPSVRVNSASKWSARPNDTVLAAGAIVVQFACLAGGGEEPGQSKWS